MPDAYSVLGVTAQTSREDVRSAYRRLARRWHPDQHAASPAHVRDDAERRMKELNAAYDAIVSGRAASTRHATYAAYRSARPAAESAWAGFSSAFQETVRRDGERLADWYVGTGPTLRESLREFRDILLGRQSPPMTIEQVARRLRTSPRAVTRMIDRGTLQAHVVAGVVRVTPDALAAYLYGRLAGPSARR